MVSCRQQEAREENEIKIKMLTSIVREKNCVLFGIPITLPPSLVHADDDYCRRKIVMNSSLRGEIIITTVIFPRRHTVK